ncbi:Mitochondrial zinc maintenance protein 1, mitochondrial [Monascus purpureus]|nr:Mitochondrial zinc maintenance protein 1, mitochondrial [Monascus purpureus]
MAIQATVSARSAYRQLLRATRLAFKDDTRVLLAARQQARQNFDQNRREGVDTPMKINHAVEVANILRHNIVQGVREADNEEARWKLRIHNEIERGDNDTVKVGGNNVKVDGPCCSSS